MRGLKSEELEAVVDFLYYGEANIVEEKLETFLAIAEELKLRGIEGGETNVEAEENFVIPPKTTTKQKPNCNGQNQTKSEINEDVGTEVNMFNSFNEEQYTVDRAVTLSKEAFYGEMHGLDERLKTLMVLGKPTGDRKTLYICRVCGKERQSMQIKDHIEANHLEGILVPCNHCDKTFRSRNALRCHKRTCSK